MAAQKGEETALGTARGRFIESLPRKAIELRGAIALLTATPAAEGPREDMRRRLHTLYASALVFRNDELAAAVKEGIDRLDLARDGQRPLSADDLDLLTRLVKRIPELRGDGPGEKAEQSAASPPQATNALSSPSSSPRSLTPGREPPRTLVGLQPLLLSSLIQPQSAPVARADPTLGAPPPRPDKGPSMPERADEGPPPEKVTLSVQARLRTPVLQRVLSVLAVGDDRDELERLFESDALVVTVVSNVRDALEAARAHAPDVIAADATLARAGVLIGSLRGNPLTDFVPVVLLESKDRPLDVAEGRELGADDITARPFTTERLLRVLGRVTGTLVEGTELALPFEATLEEIAAHVGEEVRRGIVDAAETGRDVRLPVGEGAEVMAAAWAAVARVRAFVSQQSGGRVRFSDRPLRAGTHMLALSGDAAAQADLIGESVLRGRRILVADDDTAVVLFFAGVLRAEGATVLEASDGRDALRAARRERPDVVISDVLMPGLDGFALCRELKRDPLLTDVPVILISWKEDLLARMRELSSGASDYLRKEAGAAHILESVRNVLKPRMDLEAQLKASGEVRGNLEGTGIVALLRSVRRTRPDARVSLRDAFSHFECELREGRLAQLTRTASDGNFTRGERALPQLLGATAGRFAVSDAEGPLRPAFEGTLDEVLTRGARELGALLDVLSPRNLPSVARVVLDEEAYGAMLKQAPEALRKIIERLHAGESPAHMLARDPVHPALLEAMLSELSRRGAIRGVIGAGGEDLVANARRQRSEERPMELASPGSNAPPPSRAAEGAPARQPDLPSVLDPSAAFHDGLDPTSEPAPSPSEPVASPLLGALKAVALESADLVANMGPAPASVAGNPVRGHEKGAGVPDDEATTDEFEGVSKADAERVLRTAGEAQAGAGAYSSDRFEDSDPPSEGARSERPPLESEPAGPPQREPPILDEVTRDSEILASEERRSRSTLAGWAVALIVLMAVGFAIGRRESSETLSEVDAIGRGKVVETPAESRVSAKPTARDAIAVVPSSPARVQSLAVAPRGDAIVAAHDAGFEVFMGILDHGVPVASDQGLVVLEAPPGSAAAEVVVDGKPSGVLPVKLALSEGVHELAIAHGDAVSYRFVSVRRGKTWVLRSP